MKFTAAVVTFRSTIYAFTSAWDRPPRSTAWRFIGLPEGATQSKIWTLTGSTPYLKGKESFRVNNSDLHRQELKVIRKKISNRIIGPMGWKEGHYIVARKTRNLASSRTQEQPARRKKKSKLVQKEMRVLALIH